MQYNHHPRLIDVHPLVERKKQNQRTHAVSLALLGVPRGGARWGIRRGSDGGRDFTVAPIMTRVIAVATVHPNVSWVEIPVDAGRSVTADMSLCARPLGADGLSMSATVWADPAGSCLSEGLPPSMRADAAPDAAEQADEEERADSTADSDHQRLVA